MQYTLGVLGFGEAGYEISKGLHSEGLEGIHVWKREPWTEVVRVRAAEAGVTLCQEAAEVTEVCDVIFSLVSPSAAVTVAQAAAPGIVGKFYLDLNAASLKTKEEAAAAVLAANGRFIDGAIMGPLKKQRHQVSTLISGEGAEELAAILQNWGMNVRAIGSKIGLASTVKMIRSVYSKGLETCVLEFMIAAHRYGATELVLESLEELFELVPLFQLPFRRMVAELVLEQVDHAARRADEMEQVACTLAELGIQPLMARASMERLRWVADEIRLRASFEGRTPSSYEEVLEIIETVSKSTV